MKNVLLVFGGQSYEHDISIVTAMQVFQNVNLSEVRLIPLYVSRENKMFLYESKNWNLKDFSLTKCAEKNKNFKAVEFVFGEKNKLFIHSLFGLKEYLWVDAAIFACHGGIGENGELVATFRQMNIAVSAGSVDGLGVCMNKFLFKQVMKGLKVPIVKGFKVSSDDFFDVEKRKYIDLKLRFFNFPVVVKVNSGGSSIGVFVAKNEIEFEESLKHAFEFDDVVVVERFISKAREFNVAVLGNFSGFEVSEIDEPVKKEELLTFADKYLKSGKTQKGSKGKLGGMDGIKKKFPAEIPIDLAEKIKFYAGRIFKELNLCGVVRIDFLYDEENDKLFVCEANAIPGSLAYYFFNRGRVVIDEFVLKLIDIAEDVHQKSKRFNKEFVTNILG